MPYEPSISPQPFFSVVITTYNRAHLITRALDSLIAQTETDWEALVVDDGSTDQTFVKIMPHLFSYPKIKYIRKIHSGESASKNEGICASMGKYITFLDSDDEYSPDHLETRKKILMEEPSIRLLHGGVEIIGNPYVPDRFDHTKLVRLSECAIGGTFFIERNTLFQLNGFENILVGTDADLFERAKKQQLHIKETTLPTYIYHHEIQDSITNSLYFNVAILQRASA